MLAQLGTNSYYVIGISAYGMRQCGLAGIPSVYLAVSPHVDWIYENIRH